MRLSKFILKLFGWSVSVSVPDYPKSIICVAPHTSNWDFVLCELAITSVGRHAGFLMKDTWFRWPLGAFFRSIGGIAVPRRRHGTGSLTDFLIEKFRTSERLVVAITPEGTRSHTSDWHTGFLHIAYSTGVPVGLAVLDFPSHRIMLDTVFTPTGDVDADMKAIKKFYVPYQGKYPDKFTTE